MKDKTTLLNTLFKSSIKDGVLSESEEGYRLNFDRIEIDLHRGSKAEVSLYLKNEKVYTYELASVVNTGDTIVLTGIKGSMAVLIT